MEGDKPVWPTAVLGRLLQAIAKATLRNWPAWIWLDRQASYFKWLDAVKLATAVATSSGGQGSCRIALRSAACARDSDAEKGRCGQRGRQPRTERLRAPENLPARDRAQLSTNTRQPR